MIPQDSFRSEVRLGHRQLSTRDFVPPHVSLVVVNYNYGKYIGATIRSILDQTYPWFDCLIVDNASTDNSLDVVRSHITNDPRFTIVKLDRNYGHIGAAAQILDRLKGEFVTFVDADDILFPEFVATHVQTHLSLHQSVGITTSNILEIDGAGQIISGATAWLTPSFMGGWAGFRNLHGIPQLPMFTDEAIQELSKSCSLLPWNQRGWLWAPGTSSMYRRSVLRMLPPIFKGEVRRGGVDCYFNYFAHGLTGTGLIGLPLAGYRVHGGNDFAIRPMLNEVRAGPPSAETVDDEITCLVGKALFRYADQLIFATHAPRFWEFTDVVLYRGYRPHADFYGRMTDAIAESYPVLVKYYGEKQTLATLRARLRYRDFRKMLRAVHQNGLSRSARKTALLLEFRRHAARGLRPLLHRKVA